MKMEFEFIKFEEVEQVANARPRKTLQFLCRNKKHGHKLGLVTWRATWRKYVFVPESADCIFSSGCLRDVAAFMGSIPR